jgi:hypothetical protein
VKYRKKTMVIEAEVFNPELVELPFTGRGDPCCYDGHEWYIETLEGRNHIRLAAGDMVIRGVKGEFSPCKPNIFEKTYEPVENSAALWGRVAKLEEALRMAVQFADDYIELGVTRIKPQGRHDPFEVRKVGLVALSARQDGGDG